MLESHGWKPHGDEKAQMGKDGKWQLNVYDPDLVRMELMEFKPAEKPCCSEFTGRIRRNRLYLQVCFGTKRKNI